MVSARDFLGHSLSASLGGYIKVSAAKVAAEAIRAYLNAQDGRAE